MKVLHGMAEVAGQGIYTVQGLRKNGLDANMAVWKKNPMNYDTDIDLKIKLEGHKWKYPFYAMKMGLFALHALNTYDIIHSHFGYSLFPYNLDLTLIKKKKKRIFAEFHGSDIRFLFNDIKYDCYQPENADTHQKESQRRRIRRLIECSEGIILHDGELRPHLPDIDRPVYIVPLRVDIRKFSPVYPDVKKRKPVIVHAPSRRKGKGTEEILSVLRQIELDYELILVEGKSQQEALDLYKQADIVIDQISVGTYGVFAIEAMALGKPVITYISEDMKKQFPGELPIISSNCRQLRQTVEKLLLNGKERNEIGRKSREYVERYHDYVKVTKYLIQIYEKTIPDLDLFQLL